MACHVTHSTTAMAYGSQSKRIYVLAHLLLGVVVVVFRVLGVQVPDIHAHGFSAISVEINIPEHAFAHFISHVLLHVQIQVLVKIAWTHLDDGTDFVVLVHGHLSSDTVLPVHDVLVQLLDGLRGFRDRDLHHEGWRSWDRT